MDNIIILGIILIIFAFSGEILLKKRFKIERKRNDMSRLAKRFQFILLAISYTAFIIVSIVFISADEEFNVLFIMFPFLFAVSAIRGFMEWKYNRVANRWISEIFGASFFTILTLAILYFEFS